MGPSNSGDVRLSDSDQMPRSLALTLIAGSLVGTGFWAILTVLLVS